MDINLIRGIAQFIKTAGELTDGLMANNKVLRTKYEQLQKAAKEQTPAPETKKLDPVLIKTACEALVAARLLKQEELQTAVDKLQQDPALGMKFLKAAADEVVASQKAAKPLARVAAGPGKASGETKRESDLAYERRFGAGRVQ